MPADRNRCRAPTERAIFLQKWIALAEVVLANLAWLDELDLEGWFIATVLAVAAGAAIWLLVGPWWLVAAASGYLLLLVAVRLTVGRRRRGAER